MNRNRRILIICSLTILLIASVVAVFVLLTKRSAVDRLFQTDSSIVDRETLNTFTKKSASSASLGRLSSSLSPPTNSWISGLALQEQPLAVFPMPLSFQASDTGFQIGLPTILSQPTVITGGHVVGLEAKLKGATSFSLTRYDKTSASLTYKNDETEIGRVTLAQGSPYVFMRALEDSELIVENIGNNQPTNGSLRYSKDGKEYVLAAHETAQIKTTGGAATVVLPKGSLLTIYALPNGSEDSLAKFSSNEISSVEITHEDKGEESLTKFNYRTENNQPTVVSFLPYQTLDDASKISLVYQSTYGDMQTYTGNTFITKVPAITPSLELDVKMLSESEKTKVINSLNRDSQNIIIVPQDSYFAGKQLARLANLLSIAKQLDQDETAKTLQDVLKKELTKRLDASYFYYDTDLKGMAAQTSAFGSEDFNDHHFHYGYIIHAATILARYDDSFIDEYKDEVNLLVADIASYETYDEFPVNRYFDPYSGHSWAAGLAPFQDGNNQESSSEALNAWNAVASWAEVIDNKSLQQSARWMLSAEANAAAKAWRTVDTSYGYLKNYTSPVASLSFGGKRTYSTFFSDESNAKLGIQLIPMSPVMRSFSSDNEIIVENISQQTKPNNYNVALGDYILMYKALTDKAQAIEALSEQTDTFIDDGNSRTYLTAWIYSQNN